MESTASNLPEDGKPVKKINEASEEKYESAGEYTTLHGARVYGGPDLNPEVMNRPVAFSAAGHAESKKFRRMAVTFGDFVNKTAQHREQAEKNGACFVLGAISGTERKAAALLSADAIGIDVDTGMTFNDALAICQERGKFTLGYTTYSNGSTVTKIPRSVLVDWIRKREGLSEPRMYTHDDVVAYLREERGYLPHVLDSVKIEPEDENGKKGWSVIISHVAIEKFRLLFPLTRTFKVHEHGLGPKAGEKVFRERYRGFCREMEMFHDESCEGVERLFYIPAHPPKAKASEGPDSPVEAYRVVILNGEPVDFENVERVAAANKNGATVNNEWSGEADTLRGGKKKAEPPKDDFDRVIYAHGNKFLFATFFRDGEHDSTTGSTRDEQGTCPFGDAHASGDDEGFSCDDADKLKGKTCKASCLHHTCKSAEYDRIDFLREICRQRGTTAAELKSYVDLDEGEKFVLDEEPEEQAPPEQNEPKTRKKKGAKYTKLPEESEAVLHDLNKTAAVVRVRGKTSVLTEPSNPDLLPALGSAADFTLYCNAMACIEDTDGEPHKPAPMWLKWTGRRTYDGIDFDPAADPSVNDAREGIPYNIWRGNKVRKPAQPQPGVSWSLLRTHIRDTVCHGNEEWFHWTMTWLANLFVNPHEKFGSSIVLKGKRGTGKNKLLDWVRAAIGPRHSIAVASKTQLLGRFNGHHFGKTLMVAEECMWAGDHESVGTLKDLITSDTMNMEDKHQAIVQVRNFLRLAFTSNEAWVVPAGLDDERRFFVLEILPKWAGKPERIVFFKSIDAEMKAGGLEAMVHELEHWDPTGGGKYPAGWDILRNPPRTPWLTEQGLDSLARGEAFFVEMIRAGGCEGLLPPNGAAAVTGFLFEEPTGHDVDSRIEPNDPVLKGDGDGKLHLPVKWVRAQYQHWLARNVANADARVQLLGDHRVREMMEKWLHADLEVKGSDGDAPRRRYGDRNSPPLRCFVVPTLAEILKRHEALGRRFEVD